MSARTINGVRYGKVGLFLLPLVSFSPEELALIEDREPIFSTERDFQPTPSPVVVRRGDAQLVPVASECVLVAVQADGTRVPAVRAIYGESDREASTFPSPDAAARFAVEVLRALGVVSTLDIQPLEQR